MLQETHDAVMAMLKQTAEEIGSEARLDTLQNGVTLLSFVCPMHDDGTGLVLFQVSLLRENDEWELLQVASTLQPSIGKNLPQLEKAVARWNFDALVGCYGIYYQADQLYHKYRLLLTQNEDAAVIAQRASDALTAIYDELARRFDTAEALVAGTLTFEQATAQGMC